MEYKQAIVVRTDLDMGRGKMVAQGAHASVDAALNAPAKARDEWRAQGAKKIALKIESEKALLELFSKTKSAKIVCALISDAGHTQLEPGTITALAIGPAPAKEIDAIVGTLKLL